MSKHSKWAKIKHDKGASDAKRGQVFTKLGRAIAVAARKGADPAMNPALRMAIDAARAGNMPKDTIERAIARASSADGVAIEVVVYEGFGPSGIAFLIIGATDNKNRTTAEIRHLLDKAGGSLGATGSTAWMFENFVPKYRVPVADDARQGLQDLIEELEAHDDVQSVYTNADL